MEDVVYTEVNDYYQYLFNVPKVFQASQFSEPYIGFTSVERGIEYSRAVWGKFIEKKYSPLVIRFVWEHMRSQGSIPSLNTALNDQGSSLRDALIEYHLWNFQAGPSCDTMLYYAEGKHYPTIRKRASVSYVPPQRTIRDTVQPMGVVYHPVLVNNNLMMAIVSNIELFPYDAAVFQSFDYVINESNQGGFRQLSNGVYVKLSVSDPRNWFVYESVPTVVDDIIVYPNPFYPKQSSLLKFRIPSTMNTVASLDIFSMSMRHIYSGDLPIVTLRPLEPGVQWNGMMSDGEEAPSGVYFYILKDGDTEYKGKFSLLQD